MRFNLFRMAAILVILVSGTTLRAADVVVPDELKPWQGWVLHGEEFRRCPFFGNRQPQSQNEFVCAWPERLVLDVSARGGAFTQRWQVYADSWIALPGDQTYWPRDVRLNGMPAAVVARSGAPHLRLSPGSYTVNGALQWSNRPEQLAIPAQTGIVNLTVDGREVAQPERAGSNLWLGKRRAAEEREQLAVQVYRLVKDDVPVMLATHIRVQVSGEAREAQLGRALPEGFVPMSILSALPARIEPDGSLRVQLRPGQWNIVVEARGGGVASDLTAPIAAASGEEIWSYQANDRLRITAVEGVESIDPAQANAPGEWRGLPAYRMTQNAVFKVVERSRGLEAQDANQLHLERRMWLDFEHGGFTLIDNINGTMRRDWRLDMAQPFNVLSARVAGDTHLLVTKGPAPELSGVEVRTPNLQLEAVGRLAQSSGRMSATGWQERFASVSGELNLPPGHRLVSALGQVDAPTSWTARWGLLDFFIVLIVAVAAWKLRSIVFGVLALAALALVHQEERMFAWLLVNVLIAVALVNVAPMGRLRTIVSWYRNAAFGLIVLAFLPFALDQVRLGLYPQLDVRRGYGMLMIQTKEREAPAAEAPALDIAMAQPALEETAAVMPKMYTRGASTASVSQRYAPGTVVQTGPGVPGWRYNTYPYAWSGPVNADETVRFVIATPIWMFVWRVFGVVLLALVIIEIARLSFKIDGAKAALAPFMKKSAAQSAAIALAFVVSIVSTSLHAATPEPQILSELRTRLTQPPVCAPNCVEALSAHVTATPQQLDVRMEVSALANVATAIPVAIGRWEPESVTVNGQTAGAIYRDAQQNYWVALKPGAHTVRLSGRVAPAEAVQLTFPQRPRAISVSVNGWEFSGVSEGRLLSGTLELTRQRRAQGGERLAAAEFAPFVRVRRLVQFDLDWTVTTVVERIAPDKGAFTIEVPLLANESVLTPGVTQREANGVRSLLVGMAAGQQSVTWTSALPRAETLELAMTANADRTEFWSFAVSPVWNVQFAGVPQVSPEDAQAATWTFDYFPRAGETLKLAIFRPEAAAGNTLAIDSVRLNADVGKRSTHTSLQLQYRSTQGGRHTIVLPKDAQVTSVTADDAPVPVRPQNGELPISLLPGAHRLTIDWQTDAGASWRTQAPQVDLRSAASNITTQINLGGERWVLYARGPGVGPAILYWGELIVFIVLAVLLGRYTQSPLKLHDWLLLGLGLSTFSWGVLLLFAVWVFALRWRESFERTLLDWQFNLRQIGLGALSVFAIGSLVAAIPNGLLRQPDMSVRSPGAGFEWFVDQSASLLPQPSVFSVPLIVYKIAILLWALWLSFALIRWLPWAWHAFAKDGLWRGKLARQHGASGGAA